MPVRCFECKRMTDSPVRDTKLRISLCPECHADDAHREHAAADPHCTCNDCMADHAAQEDRT